MRQLRRPTITLPTLTTGAGAKKAAEHVKDFGAGTTDFAFPEHWKNHDVRGALRAMHGQACAFCLSPFTRGDRGDVEHFRPKHLYWWLAYAFENYLLSCSSCNRRFKRHEFPLLSGSARIDYANKHQLATEARLLLDPSVDAVEQWLALDAIGGLYRWTAAPLLTSSSLEYARVEETIRRFHWNDDPDLLQARDDAIDEVLKAIEDHKWGDVRRKASRFLPHGGAIRQLLSSVCPWLSLPSVEDEFAWFLDDLWSLWQWASKCASDLGEKHLDELRWTFAVLWRAPPIGNATVMENWLDRKGIKAQIEPFRIKL